MTDVKNIRLSRKIDALLESNRILVETLAKLIYVLDEEDEDDDEMPELFIPGLRRMETKAIVDMVHRNKLLN